MLAPAGSGRMSPFQGQGGVWGGGGGQGGSTTSFPKNTPTRYAPGLSTPRISSGQCIASPRRGLGAWSDSLSPSGFDRSNTSCHHRKPALPRGGDPQQFIGGLATTVKVLAEQSSAAGPWAGVPQSAGASRAMAY